MVDRIWTRVHVGLAVASALIVLLASGVAITRISTDHARRVAVDVSHGPAGTGVSGPADRSSAGSGAEANGANPSAGANSGAGGAAGPAAAPASAAAFVPGLPGSRSSGPTAGAAASSGPAAGDGSATTGGGERASASSADQATPSGPGNRSPSGPGDGAPPSGSDQGGGHGAGQGPGGGGAAAPGEQPPQDMHLIGASVSAGQGAAGGVVGVKVGGATPEADVTVGTNPVVGNHPPANGTGIGLSGRFFHPPPSVPVLPG